MEKNMLYKVTIYEKDGSKRTSYVRKRPRTNYISKEDLLKQELSLKILNINDHYYLCNLKDEKLVKIYSKSATHISKGLNKLKENGSLEVKSEEGRKKFRRVINKLKLKQCPHCGTGFKPKYNIQKYCSKDCSKKSRQDRDAERKRELRKQSQKPPLGTTNIGPHPKSNPNEEMKFIHSLKEKTLKK